MQSVAIQLPSNNCLNESNWNAYFRLLSHQKRGFTWSVSTEQGLTCLYRKKQLHWEEGHICESQAEFQGHITKPKSLPMTLLLQRMSTWTPIQMVHLHLPLTMRSLCLTFPNEHKIIISKTYICIGRFLEAISLFSSNP